MNLREKLCKNLIYLMQIVVCYVNDLLVNQYFLVITSPSLNPPTPLKMYINNNNNNNNNNKSSSLLIT